MRVFAHLVAVLAISAVSAAVNAAGKTCAQSADPCKCIGNAGSDAQVVQANRVLQCLREGKRVELQHVTVTGDLDLATLPVIPIEDGTRLPGLGPARSGLDLEGLERDLGVEVATATLVRAPIAISDATLTGRLSAGVDKSGKFHAVVVFLHPVHLQRVEFQGEVNLSRATFRNPVDFEGSLFKGRANFRHTRFDANAFFTDSTASKGANFADSRFLRHALFEGFQTRDGTQTTFARARLHRGAAFHKSGKRVAVIPNLTFSEAESSGDTVSFQDAELASPNFDKFHAAAGSRFDRTAFTGEVASFRSARLADGVVFDDAKFANRASFRQAEFIGRRPASFDRASLSKGADFDQARFESPLAMVGATASGRLSFLDAQFQSTFDVRRSRLSALLLGHQQSRSRVAGDALFDGADVEHAIFDNTDFAGRASFVGAMFGPREQCSRPSAVGISLANARFSGPVQFTDTVFRGVANIYHLAADPGQIGWRWNQVAERWTVRPGTTVGAQSSAGCLELSSSTPGGGWEAAARGDALRLMERNFRVRELADDAIEARLALEHEESMSAIGDTGLASAARMLAWARHWTYGVLLGYGLRPWRLIAELAMLLALGALVYWWSGLQLGLESSGTVTSSWRSFSLPFQEDAPAFPVPTKPAVAALAVSLAVLAPVRVRGAFAVVPVGHPLRWFGYVQRFLGCVLAAFLALSVANTMPVLQKLLGSWAIV